MTTVFWQRMLLAAGLISITAAAIAAHSRIPWSDEGQFSSASWNLARHGFMGTTVFDPAVTHLTRIDQRTYWVEPLYLLGQAGWLLVFPATIFAIRLFSVLWMPIAMFGFWRFLTGIGLNARASALAVCLLGSSYIFIDNAAFARPDVMCFGLGLCGLAAYVEWRAEHFYRALLISNAFIAASGLTHPNGVFHLLALVVVVLYYDRRRLTVSSLAVAAIPYVVFGLMWAGYISQDYAAFVDQMRANGTNERWTRTLNPIQILLNEIRLRYMVVFGLATRGFALLKLPALIIYLGALAGTLWQPALRRQPAVRLLLILLAVYFAALSVFNQKLSYYLIHIVPWYLAIVAVYSEWLWGRFPSLRRLLVVAALAFASLEVGGILLRVYLRRAMPSQERAAVEFAQAHARANDRIVASAALIYDFGFDSRLRDDGQFGVTAGYTPDVIVIEPVYRENYEGLKAQGRPEFGALTTRLAEYRLAFDNGVCQVYLDPKSGRQTATQ